MQFTYSECVQTITGNLSFARILALINLWKKSAKCVEIHQKQTIQVCRKGLFNFKLDCTTNCTLCVGCVVRDGSPDMVGVQ